jgi:D-alanyl-D-alanine dipeptidase
MKKIILGTILLFSFILNAQKLPKAFVYLEDIAPTIQIELRYFSDNNFIGKPIPGYKNNRLIITEETAKSLKKNSTRIIKKSIRSKNI